MFFSHVTHLSSLPPFLRIWFEHVIRNAGAAPMVNLNAKTVTLHLPFDEPHGDPHLGFVKFIPALHNLRELSYWRSYVNSSGAS